jgi:ferredoxin, 2Fe-2S
MPRVTFMVTNAQPRVIDVPPRATLLRAAVRARMPIGRSCRGGAVCAACRIVIVEGRDAVEPMDDLEARLAAHAPLAEHERYACCARITGDVTVTTSYW